MERHNITEIETRFGYRSFELWQGDLTAIGERIHALAVSALPSNYDLVPGTVVAALQEKLNVSVADLAEDKALDFRPLLDCWLSRPIDRGPYDRIVCVETLRGQSEIRSTLENVFVFLALCEAKGIEFETIALPVLGAGNQQYDHREVIDVLVPAALRHLERSFSTKRILFVAYQPDTAAILSTQMDEHLGRVAVTTSSGPIEDELRRELDLLFSRVAHLPLSSQPPNLAELRRLILSEQSRALEIGISARRLVEFMAASLLKKKKAGDLLGDIEALGAAGVAPWIRSYMHTLRVFGNEQAHLRNAANRRYPTHVGGQDVTVCLMCIRQLLDFWVHRSA